jgi:hypothetical protein
MAQMKPGASEDYAFTMKIIEPGGRGYYEVRSDALGPLKPVTESVYKELRTTMVEMDIDTAHQPEEMGARLLGTFFVNLSAFKKSES